jgi:hypothetical protein
MFDAIKRGNKEPKKLKGGVCAIERIKEKKNPREVCCNKKKK